MWLREGVSTPEDLVQAAIEADLRALHLETDASTIGRLASYLKLLQHWNAAYNLTAIREPEAMRVQHLADCLAVVPSLQKQLASWRAGRVYDAGRPLRCLDVGSGGGLPGVVLAIMEPHWQVHCVDTVGKKAAFIRQVAGELALPNLRAIHGRVEALQLSGRPDGASEADAGFDVITSRAFASLQDFVRWTQHLLAPGGFWMAMKGRNPETETHDLPAGVKVMAIEKIQPPGVEGDRCLVWMNQHS